MKIQRSTITYVCDYCSRKHSTKKSAAACEAVCKDNREKALQLKTEAKKFEKEFFESESVSVIAEKLSTYLTKQSGKECKVVFSVNPNERCSSSHSAPKGQRTNWCWGDPNRPTGYLGLTGNIEIRIAGGYCAEVSRAWDNIRYKFCIHTGCGGARGCGLGYGVTLWADDFPKIKEKLEEYFKRVKNRQIFKHDCEQIDNEYRASQHRFVEGHPSYLEKKIAAIDAQRAATEESVKLTNLFREQNPKPESKFETVTQQDIRNQLETII